MNTAALSTSTAPTAPPARLPSVRELHERMADVSTRAQAIFAALREGRQIDSDPVLRCLIDCHDVAVGYSATLRNWGMPADPPPGTAAAAAAPRTTPVKPLKPEGWLGTAQVAHRLGVSRQGLYKRISLGQFPRFERKDGRETYWRESTVDAHIANLPTTRKATTA